MIGKIANNIDWVSRILGMAGGCVVLVLMFVTCYHVLMRYAFSQGLDWVIEVSGYLCIVCVYLGVSYTLLSGKHIRLGLFVRRLRPRAQAIMRTVTMFLCLVLFAVLAWQTWIIAWESFLSGKCSTTHLTIPLFPIQIVVTIGFAVMSLQAVVIIYRYILSLRSGV